MNLSELMAQQAPVNPLDVLLQHQPSEQAQAALEATAPKETLEDRLVAFQSIVPPDAPAPTPVDPWDPATQAAAMDATVGTVEEPVKKKRGRPKKVATVERDPVTTATGSLPLPGQETLPHTEQPTALYAEPIAQVEVTRSAPVAERDPVTPATGSLTVTDQPLWSQPNPFPAPVAKPQAVKGFTLYLNAIPTKGDRRDIMLAEDFVAPLMREIADANGVSDARQIRFEWQNILAARVLAEAKAGKLPAAIIVCGYGKEQDAILGLIPYAEFVVKGV